MKAHRVLSAIVAASLVAAAIAPIASAQDPQSAKKNDEELQRLVAPIALYPDSLVAHILPASTVPIDVVEAARYLNERGGKVEESPEVPWLPSVRALLRFPDVLYKMDKEIAWTQELGETVIVQQPDVMDAIQHVRKIAEESGALESNDKQKIEVENEFITIVPANPEVIYVPVYDPTVIYVQQEPTTVVVHDDSDDEAAAVGFVAGVLVGAAFAADECDWHGHHISHYGYYGWASASLPIATPYTWRPGPGGVYDPRGIYDPRGLYDPRGVYDPRGIYDPRGLYDPRGVHDTRGKLDPRGAAAPRGAAGVGTVPNGTRGVGAAGYNKPVAGGGAFGPIGQNKVSSRQSVRGATSLAPATGSRGMRQGVGASRGGGKPGVSAGGRGGGGGGQR